MEQLDIFNHKTMVLVGLSFEMNQVIIVGMKH